MLVSCVSCVDRMHSSSVDVRESTVYSVCKLCTEGQ